MAKMSQRMKEIFDKQQSIVLATATKDGISNVVPISTKKIIDDETILIGDNFLGKTLKNIESNPQAAVTFWDGLEGYQIKAKVAVETAGPTFEETVQWVEALAKKFNLPLKAKGAVVLKIVEIYSVTPGPDAGAKIS